MSHIIHQVAFYLHVSVGCFALIVFWLPLFAKKGSKPHLRYGRWFANSMFIIAVSGVLLTTLALMDPIGVRTPERNLSFEAATRMAEGYREFSWFLLMLSVLVFNSTYHSIQVLRAKANRQLMRNWKHLSLIIGLFLLSIVTAIIGTLEGMLLLQVFAGLSLANSIGMAHYIYKAEIKQREWILAHMRGIVGSGIGAYTAFFAFGGRQLFAELLTGNLMVIPWILPAVIGVISMSAFKKKYIQQYRIA
ncbi:hypothetical protein [Pleionea sp. CnH1-48]|uniref:hypothetical protein n=1 Tax=Pleionea sp. CnH1-48 TaxID=2954494 RepID=UPI0020986214|nr:hypothetical protein [Pleionea sp. CnH1-48]MCO7224088.1 hypothetical protein [Pleionea sp. CnH1-48]